MEYRRRRRRGNRKASQGGGGKAFLLIAILLAAVYFVSVSAVGSWLSKNVVKPVAAFFTQEEKTAENAKSDEAVQTSVTSRGRIDLPAMECYLLQTGVFSDEENAKEAAQTVKNGGGAGFVWYDGERYRVFVSGYSTEADARDAKQALALQGTDSSVHSLRSAGAYDVTVTAGTDTTVSQLQTVLYALLSAHDDLLDLEKQFDAGGLTPQECAKAVGDIYEQLDRATQKTDGLPKVVTDMLAECKSTLKAVSESGASDNMEFASKLRYAQVEIACRFTETINRLIGD